MLVFSLVRQDKSISKAKITVWYSLENYEVSEQYEMSPQCQIQAQKAIEKRLVLNEVE